jgi:tripartite-type tricarboxylate transporter receptor subunit TctC
MFANVVAVLTPIKSGKLRALATSAEKRPPSMPDLPTAIEAGVPGYVVTSWFGLLAPARTPQPRIAKLNAALLAAMREREVVERLSSEGAEPVGGTGDAFARHIADEHKIWGKVIKASGL